MNRCRINPEQATAMMNFINESVQEAIKKHMLSQPFASSSVNFAIAIGDLALAARKFAIANPLVVDSLSPGSMDIGFEALLMNAIYAFTVNVTNMFNEQVGFKTGVATANGDELKSDDVSRIVRENEQLKSLLNEMGVPTRELF